VESWGRIAQVHAHHAVVDLAPVAVPLPPHPHRVAATLGDSRFVDHADRLRVRVIAGHDLLATVVQSLLVPLDRFQETL
jgi:hypothetical protein